MIEKINLLYVIDKLYIGGTEKQLMALINGLDRSIFRPEIVTLRQNDKLFCRKFNCKINSINMTSLLSFNGIRKLIRLSKYIKSEKIDIVQTFFIDATIFGVLAARLGGANQVITSRRDMGYWYTKEILFFMRVINRLTDKIIVNSNAIKEKVEKVEKLQSKKISVINNGILKESFLKFDSKIREDTKRKYGIKKNDLIIGILSNLNRPVKGVDIFIRSAKIVYKNVQNVSFVIAGDGHLKNKLQNLCKVLSIEKKVKFLGQIENVQEIINTFDIAVNSSISEGFSNAVLEYMACGIPVVATNCGGSIEIIKNGKEGILVTPDPEKLGNAILILVRDRKLRNKISEAGYTLVKKKFDVEKMIKKTESLYYNCLSLKRKRSKKLLAAC